MDDNKKIIIKLLLLKLNNMFLNVIYQLTTFKMNIYFAIYRNK